MNLDLLNDDPQRLAREASPDDLLAAVRAVEVWTDRHGQVLDHIYRNRIARQFRTGVTRDEMAALLDHLQRVAHSRRAPALDALDRRYAERWRAYADLLETQIAVQEAGVPDALLTRAHVAVILAGVRDGTLRTQLDVQQYCGLKEANASRVLALLDAAELVLRQRHGRENRLVAGPRLAEALQWLEEAGRLPGTVQPAQEKTVRATTMQATTAQATKIPRGCSYLSGRAA